MTGGEPCWRGNDCTLNYLNIRMQDLKNVTFETNTTQKLHDEFYRDYPNNQRGLQSVEL